MPTMQNSVQFTIDVGSHKVRGTFSRPDSNGNGRLSPAILMCDGLAVPEPHTDELFEYITDSLHRAGIATLTFGPCNQESKAKPTERLAVEAIDAASAMFLWLAVHDEIDLNRIGILGFSLGAIIAACLARCTDQIASLCLLSPTTPDDVITNSLNDSEGESAPQLGIEQANEHYFKELKHLNPIQDAAINDRPTLILHGAADRIVPAEISFKYWRTIELADHHVQHTLIALADHFFAQKPGRGLCLSHITHFFEEMDLSTLRDKVS